MATFDQGPKELRKRLADAKPHLSDAEYARIDQVIKDYESARNDVMTSLLDVFADTGRDEKKSDYNDRFANGRARVLATLTGMLDGLTSPSPDAVMLRTQAAIEESALFGGLAGCNLGSGRDLLVIFKQRLMDMIVQLRAVWETTVGEDERVQEIEKQAAREMNDILQKTIEDGIATYAQLGRKSYDVAEGMKNFPGWCLTVVKESVRALVKVAEASYSSLAPELQKGGDNAAELVDKMSDPGKELFEWAKRTGMEAKQLAAMAPYLARNPALVVGDWIDDAVKAAGGDILGPAAGGDLVFLVRMLAESKKFTFALLGPWGEARRRYTEQVPNEGLILACFSNSRKKVDEFIHDNGVDAAVTHYRGVKDQLDQWRGSVPDSLKTDADEFTVAAKNALELRMGDLVNAFGTFVSDNRGRFVGEVDSVTQAKLINFDLWRSTADGMRGLSLDQRLKDWRSQTITIQDNFESAWGQVQGAVSGLPVAFQDSFRRRLEEYYSRVKSQLADARDQTVAGLDQAAKVVEPEEIQRTFDVTQLQRALTA